MHSTGNALDTQSPAEPLLRYRQLGKARYAPVAPRWVQVSNIQRRQTGVPAHADHCPTLTRVLRACRQAVALPTMQAAQPPCSRGVVVSYPCPTRGQPASWPANLRSARWCKRSSLILGSSGAPTVLTGCRRPSSAMTWCSSASLFAAVPWLVTN